ncbi:hypothetical protein [Sphingopyxis sp.]|uniref:hypothetical protein n=1 Tax=Sphingopyxis sp. TaxID=1908224 RepID=UPI003BA9BA49
MTIYRNGILVKYDKFDLRSDGQKTKLPVFQGLDPDPPAAAVPEESPAGQGRDRRDNPAGPDKAKSGTWP